MIVDAQQIITNAYFSSGFPNRNWKHLIARDNYLSQIMLDFEDNKVIFLEGDEDSGKTTLCAQLCRKYNKNTISIYFSSLNPIDYQIDYYYTNFVSQIRFILGDDIEEIEKDEFVGIKKYNNALFQLRKKYKRNNQKVYLIIDGLEEKFQSHTELINCIIDNIPLADDFLKIIFTGSQKKFLELNQNLKKVSSKPISITGFTKHEVISFLDIKSAKNDELDELYKITKGFPGRLETSKRLISTHGYTLFDILTSDAYSKWIEMDCDIIDLNNPIYNVILSIIALSDNSFQIEDLAKITSTNYDEASQNVKSLYVLESAGTHINFISNTHKKYFANLLRGQKKKTDELLEKYFADENTLKSKFELTKIYAEKKQWSKIITLIDEEYILGTIETTGTLQRVNESIELGYKASEEMNSFSEVFKYSLQGSIINELNNYLFWESEILARISLKDFAGAIILAESAVLKVDRLRLLALVARKEKQINNKVDEELINLIQELYQNTNLSQVGNVIYDIVTDLIYAIPNLAIEIIENSSGNASDKNINDWIVAKLSIAAINSSTSDDKENQDKKNDAIQKLNNPSVRKINQAISFLVGNYSSSKVLDEVKKLSDSNERLKLLRLWLKNNNKHNKDIDVVINKALDELVLTSSESTLSLEVLKELSFQLANVREFEKKENIYQRFKVLENNITDLGLTKDKYTYQLNLFHAQFTLDKHKSITILNKIIIEVEALKDLLIKLESYSEIYAKLYILHHPAIGAKCTFIYHKIIEISTELLNSTANHFKLCFNILKTISKVNPTLGLHICSNINTLYNRDKSRLLVLDSYLDNNLRNVDIELLKEIENSFENNIPKDIALKNILERYVESKSLHFKIIKELFYFTKKIDTIDIPSNKVFCLLLKYRIISKNDEWKEKLSGEIKNRINDEWKKIEADWEKIDAGFIICSELAKIDHEYAKNIFEENEKQKSESWIDSESIATTYLNSLSLVIKAYNGLLLTNTQTEKDYTHLEDLINRLPSEIKKLNLWTEIAINCYLSDKHNITKKVYDSHILPLLQGLIYGKLNIDSALDSLILVHLYNSEMAIDFMKDFTTYMREEACIKICEFYICKRNPFEIYDGEIDKYNSTINDILKAISLMNLLETDITIYNLINDIYKSIDNNKNPLSKLQISEIVEKLNLLIESKLPDLKNIKHQGYKIISKVKVELIKKQQTNWQWFIDESRLIPNLSDKLFVKANLLENLPFDKIGPESRKKLFEEVMEDLYSLKSHYEFVDRVIDISEKMYDINRTKWKEVVNKAFATSNDFEEGTEMYSYQKNIVDSIYRLDSGFAKELIKSIDKEDKESKNTKLLKNYYETLEVANKIKNNQTLEQKEKLNNKMIIRGILKAYGALNSGKITIKKVPDVAKYLQIGYKLPLHETLPIYMFYLSNCARIVFPKNTTNNFTEINRNNFKEIVKATNLIQVLSQRRKLNESTTRKFFIDEDFSSNLAVKPGTREEAMSFIKQWMIDEMKEFVIYADSYFEAQDLEILKMIKEVDADIDINILATDDVFKNNIEDEYQKQWKKISHEIPPFANFTFCWLPEDKNYRPIHDRWIITKGGGLRLGTSFNSLGIKRESEISLMNSNEALNILENTLKDYISKRKKETNNQRLSYKSFTL
jgi:hypothetical protein